MRFGIGDGRFRHADGVGGLGGRGLSASFAVSPYRSSYDCRTSCLKGTFKERNMTTLSYT